MLSLVMRRAPAVAGMFYPANPNELRAQIRGFLSDIADPTEALAPKAIIAPHAGTIYSGPIAASAYATLRKARAQISRVVLLGPSHRVPLIGVAAPSAELFNTPLGDIPIDRAVVSDLCKLAQVTIDDEPHRREHSLEVHLPFLQESLDAFQLVPLVVGRTPAEQVAEVINRAWGGPETLIVVSSDLSHFHAYAAAQQLDRETSELIEGLAFERLDGERACGVYPVSGLLCSARDRGLSVRTIDLRNSGDTAGSKSEVVGYGSYLVQ
jgi:AmmeMemoRadiSam system protein B